jgi:hypothetical protein
MFAVIETTTGTALHLLDEAPEITEAGMVSPVRAPDIKLGAHSVVEVDAPQVRFLPGVMTATGGAWVIPDQTAYDALLAAITPPDPVPEVISDRQFFEALWQGGHITYEEAEAAVATGSIPATMAGFLDLLASYDEVGAKKARLLLKGATEFRRDNYVVPVFGSMYGMTSAQIDDLWRTASQL